MGCGAIRVIPVGEYGMKTRAKNLGLILLPIMFYHPFQLFVCGLLANRFSNQNREIPVSETSPIGQT
jgi:predicted Na+-dependent transporter